MAVNIVVVEARPGTEITLVAHTPAEVVALTTACKSIQEYIISHVMDLSTRLEEHRRFLEAKNGPRNVYAEDKEEKEEAKSYNYDLCGPGFIRRRYNWMCFKKGVSTRMMWQIVDMDRPAAIGRLIVRALRRADFKVHLYPDCGAKIGDLLVKVPTLKHLTVEAKEIYDLPKTETRFSITFPFEEAGSYHESRIRSNQAFSSSVRAAVDTTAGQETITVQVHSMASSRDFSAPRGEHQKARALRVRQGGPYGV